MVTQDVFSENSNIFRQVMFSLQLYAVSLLYNKTLANFLCGEYKECIVLILHHCVNEEPH